MPKKEKRPVPEALELVRHNVQSKGNIFGVSTKANWTRGLGLATQGETIFFGGCGYQFQGGAEASLSLVRALDKRGLPWEKSVGITKLLTTLGISPGELLGRIFHPRLSGDPLRCAVVVLQRMGVDFGCLHEEEPCCAGPLYFNGWQKEFAGLATDAHRTFQAKGVERIIGMVPSCIYTLRDIFPRFLEGWSVEVRHFLEVVREGIRSGMRFHLAQTIRVTYHDSCVMSRFLRLVEEPRDILHSIEGLELVEVDHGKGEWSTCCGGGGGFEVVFPEVSHILAKNRVKELLKTKASVIVTSCPGCLMQLRAGLKELKVRGVEVIDMAQLLERTLPEA